MVYIVYYLEVYLYVDVYIIISLIGAKLKLGKVTCDETLYRLV